MSVNSDKSTLIEIVPEVVIGLVPPMSIKLPAESCTEVTVPVLVVYPRPAT